MGLGRESLVLIAVPLLLLAGAFALLIPSPGSEAADVRTDRAVAEREGDRIAPSPSGTNPSRATDRPAATSGTNATGEGTTTVEMPTQRRAVNEATQPHGSSSTGGDHGAPRTKRPFRGHVVDDTGAPLTGAVIVVTERLNLYDKNSRPYQQQPTALTLPVGADGGFEVPRRDGFRYTIQVHAEGFATRVVGISTLSGSTVITLSPSAVVEGTIVDDATGLPVADAVVRLRMLGSGAVPRTLRTDDDGLYRFEDVPAGNGFLDVAHPGYRPESIILREIRPNDVHQRPVRLLGGMDLNGTVVCTTSGGAFDAPVTVTLHDRYLNVGAGQVAADPAGHFTFGALRPGGQYVVTATAPGYGSTSTVVLVPTSGPAPFVTLTLDDAWVLMGEVTDPLGAPLRGVRISVEPMVSVATAEPLVGFTDELGRFAIEELGDQSYRVVAFHPHHALEERTGVTRALYGEEGLQLSLEAGTTLTGTITDAAGNPVTAAWVRLQVRQSGRLNGPTIYAYSDPDGEFRFDHVHGGEATLLILASGYAPTTERFLLPSNGEPVHRAIVLHPQ